MPGLDDIDEDDFSTTAAPPTTTMAAPPAQETTVATHSSGGSGGGLTMDDIFGGLGEAPKPKAKPAAAVAAVQASPSPPPAAVSTSPKPPGGDLDDFFSAPPVAAAQPAAAQPAKKKPASDDLLGGGGGRGGATLSEAAHQDGIYVPPPGVLSFMSHYEVLSLREASATPDAVSKAYKKLAIAFHPDKRGKDMTPEEDMFFKAVTTAHEVLADADKRAEYDAARKAAKTAAGPKDDLFAHFA